MTAHAPGPAAPPDFHARLSVLRWLQACYRAAERYGLHGPDAHTSVDQVLARVPVDIFQPGAIATYFGDLDAHTRDLPAAARNEHLALLFGVEGVRAAVALCRAFALTPHDDETSHR